MKIYTEEDASLETLVGKTNSIEFSFAQPNVRTRLLQDYERELKEFENRFLGNWRGELARANPEFTEYGKKHLARTFHTLRSETA